LESLYFHKAWAARIDAFQISCVRKVLRIPTTYAARLTGQEAIKNKEVARRAKARPLSKDIMRTRFKLLGHVLRRHGADPLRAVSYDRFACPKELRAKRKAGDQRLKWTVEMVKQVEEALTHLGIMAAWSGEKGNVHGKIAALAQDRLSWNRWCDRWIKTQDWQCF